MIRILLCAAFVAHIACGYCDCLLSYGKKGRIDLKAIKDPERMRETFADVPLWQPMVSILLGTFSITVFTFGYLALSSWMYGYNRTLSYIMLAATIVFAVPIQCGSGSSTGGLLPRSCFIGSSGYAQA